MPWSAPRRTTRADQARKAKYASVEHRAARARLARVVAQGKAACWRCLKPIAVGSEWHVGHDDAGQRVMGAEHADCNRKAAAAKGARVANARRRGYTPRGYTRPMR